VPKHVWLNGKLIPPDQATVSVFDHGLLYGDGVFEGIRTYGRRIFKLRTHLQRLFASAKIVRLTIPYALEQLEAACRETVAANECDNGYVRLCVTRGVGTLGLNPFVCNNPCVFIIADTIVLYPEELYREGLSVITSSVIRNHPQALNPKMKSMNYLNNILAKIEAIEAGLLEAVMLNHKGNVSECTGDNVFIVCRDASGPTLCTPPLQAGILDGVTRNAVIELSRQLGVDVHCRDLKQDDLHSADEIFLTGTAAEVIPVTRIDQRTIGDGRPGPVTNRLMEAFRALVRDNAPED